MFKKKIFIYRKSLAFKKVKDINQNQITKNQRLNFKLKKNYFKNIKDENFSCYFMCISCSR